MTATKVLFGVAGLAVASSAMAQYSTNFEPPLYSGSAAGTLLTAGFGTPPPLGQDGWYNPVAGSNEATVHTYANNAFGFVTNPTGGTQFAVTRFGGTPAGPGRAQHAFDFNQSDVFTVGYDFCGDRFGGSLPASNNIGSFSLQNSTTAQYFQTLMVWSDLNTGNAMNHQYGVFAASGGAITFVNPPDPAFLNLNLNTWYRSTTTFSFATHQVLSISIDNLHNADPAVVVDVSGLGWFLAGGSASTLPRPTDIRLFGSGAGDDVNQMGWDNVSVVPAPATLALLGLGGLIAGRRRR
jgi:hypothetical protein